LQKLLDKKGLSGGKKLSEEVFASSENLRKSNSLPAKR